MTNLLLPEKGNPIKSCTALMFQRLEAKSHRLEVGMQRLKKIIGNGLPEVAT